MNYTKKCTSCQEDFPDSTEFFHKKGNRLTAKCKTCMSIYNRELYSKHREKRLDQKKEYGSRPDIKQRKYEYNKKYYNENKEYLLKKQSEYEVKNKDRFKDRRAKYTIEQYHKNPQLKIKMNLSRRLRDFIRKNGQRTVDFIGCTTEQLIKHLESLWKPGMNWSNYGRGGWHVDHIIPCASFDLTDPEQQKECFNYKNLQPLWEFENLSKGSKMPDELYPE